MISRRTLLQAIPLIGTAIACPPIVKRILEESSTITVGDDWIGAEIRIEGLSQIGASTIYKVVGFSEGVVDIEVDNGLGQ